MLNLSQDIRYGLRQLGKAPTFHALAALTLAVGIGANTALFSVANALLLRPLPYEHPDQLVLLASERKINSSRQGPLSWPRVEALREQSRSFSGTASFTSEVFNLSGRGDPEQLNAARVTWNFFEVLGVRPAQGRAFVADEDRPGGNLTALISDALWTRRFARAPAAVGGHITLDSKDYTIIGILPPAFRFAFLGPSIDLWTTRVFDLNLTTPAHVQSGMMFLNGVARLRPGVTIAQAQAEMDTLAAQYRRDNPKLPDADPGLTVTAGNLRDEMVANVRPALLILFGAVGLVLLIACANVAGLLLSRALGRKREMAVRAALGASRASLIRQLLTESVLLALVGGALGALFSAWGTGVLASMAQNNLPRAAEIDTDARVLAFTVIASILTGILFGLLPSLHISRPDLSSVLRSEGRGATSGRSRHTARGVLVVSQVALSMVLLVGAGLLVRNFVHLRAASQGFDSRNLLTMNIALPPARYARGEQMTAFYEELVRRVRALPGVRAATVSSALPMNPARFSPALLEGQPQIPLAERPIFTIQTFSPGYLETMRIPLLRGREFTEHDDAKAPPVAMVNESLVRRYWPNENPIGKHILLGRVVQPLEVVGVIGDVRNQNLAADAQPEIDLPFARLPWATMNLVVRTTGEPHGLAGAVRARALSIDREQPVTSVRSMQEVLDAAAAQPRFTASLLGAFAITALLLAIVGIYGVISYGIAERTQELGIRLALGAERGDILRLVLRQGLALAMTGIAIGLSASLVLSRVLATQLYQVSATDPWAFAASAVLFTAVALLASYIPAHRATRVDPMVALRQQ